MVRLVIAHSKKRKKEKGIVRLLFGPTRLDWAGLGL